MGRKRSYGLSEEKQNVIGQLIEMYNAIKPLECFMACMLYEKPP